MSEPKKPAEANSAQTPGPAHEVSRRDFFNEIAMAALGIAGLGASVVTYRFFSPNVLFEPPSSFRVGNPDQYPVDSVSFIEDQQVYIVRTTDGFYAVSAVCTHLGCITQWKPESNQIACPCHGSKFMRDGKKIEGPAPNPLPHFAIALTPDGDLRVDKLEILKPDQILRV
jgi:cytochrome b6-f complex iron-sulfur subunit